MTIRIPLSQQGWHKGKYFALIDDCDSDLTNYRWQANKGLRNHTHYAVGHDKENGNRQIKIHRIILERVLGRPLAKNEHVDHINRDGLDNRRENLRLATPKQNHANTKTYRNNTSGYKGVYYVYRTGRWLALITIDGKQKYLGYHATPEQAYEAYCQAAREAYGDYANLKDK